jgi:hypothetical protein
MRSLTPRVARRALPWEAKPKLTPEQQEQFGQLFGDNATNFFAKVATSQGGPAQEQSAVDSSAANSDLMARIRALLGDAGVARFGEFSQEIPDHAAVDLLSAQLDSNPLNPDQTARLIQVVKAQPSDLMKGLTGSPDVASWGPRRT